ncbi:uncharacterized protein B0I36DRAFT_380647 [Microdochium trichocladiopsis]|uniref:PHD-type domain-containing protein n=1 Tax=Microdochium trichocladiopsis TaxID=1682393 RepID=A0A9P8YG59_9PEZI|nr:uncharacterized protein B0I36DRAFT_380647 [Microdochium trichocladiopsis]KAH7037455.1 hypothetical protein B0I36DRAFT_380647 [Microdochium trichocladiopsis]
MSHRDIEMEDASSTESERGGPGSHADVPADEQTGNYTNSMFVPKVKPDPDATRSASSPAPTLDMSQKPRSSLKKKGTASTKKGTGRKLVNGHKLKAARERASEGTPEDGSSDADTDNGPYCICRGPDDHRWMIGCDVCEDWFHGTCVDLSKEIGERLVERFVCPNCTDGKSNYTKFRKTCSLPGCKNQARLYGIAEEERSIFCSSEHCDLWWISAINKLPTRASSGKAVEALTQEDFMGLLASTSEDGAGWKLGDSLSDDTEGLWSNGLPTQSGVLSEEEQNFLQHSASERLALGNEIVQYKKMMQVVDWANERRQAAIEAGKFTKDSCGYDYRLDTVSVKHQFAGWLDSPEGQATFKKGKLSSPLVDASIPNGHTDSSVTRGMCEKKRCKPHTGWYKLHMNAIRHLIKETTTAAAEKLEAEEVMRQEAETKFGRRKLEQNWVEVLE